MTRTHKRREFSITIVAGGTVGMAGCIGSGGTSNSSRDETSSETNSGNGNSRGDSSANSSSTGRTGNQSDTGSSGNGRQIKVGVLQPTTGDLATIGKPLQQAALLPAVQLKSADTDFTINTRTEDTQTDPLSPPGRVRAAGPPATA